MEYSKSMFSKVSAVDLHDYLQFKHRGSQVRAKEGKGSYSRKYKHLHPLFS